MPTTKCPLNPSCALKQRRERCAPCLDHISLTAPGTLLESCYLSCSCRGSSMMYQKCTVEAEDHLRDWRCTCRLRDVCSWQPCHQLSGMTGMQTITLFALPCFLLMNIDGEFHQASQTSLHRLDGRGMSDTSEGTPPVIIDMKCTSENIMR